MTEFQNKCDIYLSLLLIMETSIYNFLQVQLVVTPHWCVKNGSIGLWRRAYYIYNIHITHCVLGPVELYKVLKAI